MATDLTAVNATYYAQLGKVIDELQSKYDLNAANPPEERRFKLEDLQKAALSGVESTDGKMKWLEYGPVSCNMIWLQGAVMRPLSSGVPINRSNVRKLQEEKFATPAMARASVRAALHVGTVMGDIKRASDIGELPLRVLSCEESFHALLFSIHAKVVDGLASHAEAKEWQEILTSLPVIFEVYTSPDSFFWRSINFREHLGTEFELLYRSSVQRMFELMNFKQTYEANKAMQGTVKKSQSLSAKALHEMWNNNVRFATFVREDDETISGGGEQKFTPTFVESSMSVFGKLLVFPRVREEVLLMEEPGSPVLVVMFFVQERLGKRTLWKSVYQLNAVAAKLGGRRDAEAAALFVMETLHHYYEKGIWQPVMFSARTLSGKGASGSKGTVDYLLTKHGILQHCLQKFDSSAMVPALKTTLKTSFASWSEYRRWHQPDVPDADLTWQSGIPAEVLPLLKFTEAVCYNTTHDGKAGFLSRIRSRMGSPGQELLHRGLHCRGLARPG